MAATLSPDAAMILRESHINIREFWQNLSEDFTLTASNGAEYRFIDSANIDKIMQDELESEPYILGCMSTWALSDLTNIPDYVFDILQEAEAFEGIGKLLITVAGIEKIQNHLASWDGYGHHFANYDGDEVELKINDVLTVYMFRIN